MKEKCSSKYAVSDEVLREFDNEFQLNVLGVFLDDPASNVLRTEMLKQQLHLKFLEFKKENDEKPLLKAVAGGAGAGAAAGIGAAVGGGVGGVAITSAVTVSATVATGGLVLVGIAAVGIGVGVGFGVKALVSFIHRKNLENSSCPKKSK
uniref:Uncharacterized protein n=1 Tax=Ciona savignyi TaxID=51511 RepID=H2ZQG1_CIOSA